MSLVRRVREDVRTAGRHIGAVWSGWRLHRKRRADARALLDAYRGVGEAAAAAGAGDPREVRDREATLSARRADLEARRREEASARQALATRRNAGEKQLESLRAERARIEKTDGKGAAHAAADEAVRAAKRALGADEDRLEGDLRNAERAVRSAEQETAAAGAALDGSLEDLGRAIYESGARDPALADPLRRAREMVHVVGDDTKEIRERRRIAGETRGRARLVIGGAVGGFVAIVLLVGILSSGGEATDPSPGDVAVTADRTPAAPVVGPTTPLAESLREAVLALPALAPREMDGQPVFRPTGEISVLSDEPTAGGLRRVRVAASAERRAGPDDDFTPLTIHLVLTVDAGGRVVRGETEGYIDADDAELERMLEQW